jgi:hypothetical protein
MRSFRRSPHVLLLEAAFIVVLVIELGKFIKFVWQH